MKAGGTDYPHQRLRLVIRGAVQGVGFRPFIHRLATGLALNGWVNNSTQGVFLEVEGPRNQLEQFLLRIEADRPPRSSIQSLESSWLDPVGYHVFEIRPSQTSDDKTALVLPDIATCPDCLHEIFDPSNRRYRYPFTNCTNCGPRFSIIESLPYDRMNTSMKSFTMCRQCQAEYNNPNDRRFHAQPNACPVCGPNLGIWLSGVRQNAANDRHPQNQLHFAGRDYAALLAAAHAIQAGQIVAVKGLGGFHLMVDARNEAAVRCLRERKHREEKPLALMFPSLERVKAVCEVSPLEERLLRSPEAPIVLLRRIGNRQSAIGNSIASGNPNLGVMLPYTPLHHLLMAELGFPVVATSGNLSDEPICTDENEARERLRNIADVFLIHNRPIVHHVDDSIARIMLDREMVLRRARGYAPLPVMLKSETQNRKAEIVLAVGAHLKNTVALAVGPQIFISQHIGDLETEQAHAAFCRVVADFRKLYDATPEVIATDLHPDYLSTKFAEGQVWTSSAGRSHEGALRCGDTITPPGKPMSRSDCHRSPKLTRAQHHIAHVLSCMADNELDPPALGVSWDGTGYGLDGTIWGGEFFLVLENDVQRVASLRSFPLPGGDAAVKQPRRAALGLLHEFFGVEVFQRSDLETPKAFSATEYATLRAMLDRRLNSPPCSSAGRLFDAVASLVNLRQRIRFEGQAAMELEFALDGVETDAVYPLAIGNRQSAIELDFAPMIEAIFGDMSRGISVGEISAKFHNSLAEAIVAVTRQVGEPRVLLSGGCFQNRYLTERTVTRLRAEGFQPYWHQRVPPNDGGIALGQVVAARRQMG